MRPAFEISNAVSGGIGFVRGSVGNTWALGGQPSRFYLTGEPSYVHPVSSAGTSPKRNVLFGGGLTIGKAWGDDNNGLAYGAWASGGLFYDEQRCQDGYLIYSIAIGLRDLADVDEFFIAPKVSVFSVPAPCT